MKLRTLTAAGWSALVVGTAVLNAPSPAAGPPPELQKARETLRLSEQTRDRIAEEAAALKASGKASPEAVRAYETYLARVEDLVAENRNVVAQMEAAYTAHQARGQPAPAGAAGGPASIPPPPGSEEGSVDRLKALDRQFNESLAAFDEMLLKELRLIQAASAKRMTGLAEAAAEAGKQAGEKGGQSASPEQGSTAEGGKSESGESGSEKGSPGSEQAKTSGGQGKPGDAAGSGRETGGSGSGGTGAPPSTYTPSPDDDIVARQLREAAEKETDPELKAKLWKEYEEYKKSRAKP